MAVTGEVTTMIAALGAERESAEVRAVLDLAGKTTPEDPYKVGKNWYQVLRAESSGVSVQFKDGWLLKVVCRINPETGWATYPRPANIIDGIDEKTDRDGVLSVLGPPMKSGRTADTFAVSGRKVNVLYRDGIVSRITALVSGN